MRNANQFRHVIYFNVKGLSRVKVFFDPFDRDYILIIDDPNLYQITSQFLFQGQKGGS